MKPAREDKAQAVRPRFAGYLAHLILAGAAVLWLYQTYRNIPLSRWASWPWMLLGYPLIEAVLDALPDFVVYVFSFLMVYLPLELLRFAISWLTCKLKPKLVPARMSLLCSSCMFIIVCLFVLFIPHRKEPEKLSTCGSHIRSLAVALIVYAADHNQVLPAGESWCDDLICGDYITDWSEFLCDRSDAVIGESSYAMNKYAGGRPVSQLPPDMVLLFETDLGRDPNDRKMLLKDRKCYNVQPPIETKKYLDFVEVKRMYPPETKVSEQRWNQVGGPENVTPEYHNGDGCNVAFVDGHVEFLHPVSVAKLKWKPDANQ